MEEIMEITETHPKTIIHIDIDYFYAQVEEINDKSLSTKPVGINQQKIIVTCNYVAREYGVKKLMSINDALKLCPNLVIINGEDLTNYKKMSQKIFDVLQKFTTNVEKLGIDENYLDVTTLVTKRLEDELLKNNNTFTLKPLGFIIPDENDFKLCSCGCDKRLIIGTHLANDIRKTLFDELGLTSSAGVSCNKLLAKLVSSKNKPNKQTLLIPICGPNYMIGLGLVRCITGVGIKMETMLKEINITTVEELQECDLEKLQKKFGYETACRLKDISFGRDYSIVRPSGRPKSIGLENSCKTISLKADVEEKFRLLLIRLVNQVIDDGRIPITIKIILRKFDTLKKTSHREIKQCNIQSTLFKKLTDGKLIICDNTHEKLLIIIMKLFERCVDLKKPFHITLIGLAFTKFNDNSNFNNNNKLLNSRSSSIANFLIKKSDLEVQSITSLCNDGISSNSSINNNNNNITSTITSPTSSSSAPTILSHKIHRSLEPMEHEQISDTSITSYSDLSENEIEPSPKKTRINGGGNVLIAKKRCLHTDQLDVASPSKLRVGDLRLNSKDSERDYTSINKTTKTIKPQQQLQLPKLLQQQQHKQQHSTNNNNNNNTCPTDVDPSVFKELPLDVQNELLASWGASIVTPIKTTVTQQQQTSKSKAAATSTTKSTLHRYFIKNK